MLEVRARRAIFELVIVWCFRTFKKHKNTYFSMKDFWFKKTAVAFAFAASALTVSAQQSPSAALADLQQDMSITKSDVGSLKLEIEQLRRDMDALRQRINDISRSSVQGDSVRAQIAGVKAQNSAQTEALKREIIAQVRKDMEDMANQTNTAISKLANAISVRPQASLTQTNFSDNFPKTGITYTVKPGDSLNKIARQNNSRAKWIQDANKITDPSRDLRVGASIFIPQE